MSNPDLESKLLKLCVKNESLLGLNDILVLGFPIWRVFRFRTRSRYLKLKMDYRHNTRKRKLLKPTLLAEAMSSFVDMVKLFISREKRENIIFAFPRLQKINGEYLDKFTDPVISSSNLKESCYVFQKPLAGTSYSPRYLATDKVIKTDFVDRLSLILGYILFPVVTLIFLKKLVAVYTNAKGFFQLNLKNFMSYGVRLGGFVSYFSIYYILLKLLKPKRVFVVDREVFFPQIRVCKVLKIPVFEFQHGATHGETPLYSGYYDKEIDPDYFLTFGSAWSGKQFGIEIKRIINIGWAYKKVVEKNTKRQANLSNNYILVVSEPPRSKEVLHAIVLLALEYKEYNFHMRLHPQESYSDELQLIVQQNVNISIQDSEIDSYTAIQQYNTIIGENSTVLYEALSLDKKVGRLAFNGLLPFKLSKKEDNSDGFTYIDNVRSFGVFINSSLAKTSNLTAFSVFNEEIVNNLPTGK